MLDTETKRRIDNARDILVGKVPDPKSQVEQITIALIYKFMDDMDAEAEALGGKRSFFAGEFEKYGWSKLMAPGMGGHEILNLYAEGITKMNENAGIPLLFREIFKNAYLPYRDPETLKSFLKEIGHFNYDHSERLGDAFEYLLSVLGSQGDAGQFRTPRHIIDFMVEVIDPKKDETILDPACGTAGFLISSYKHILKSNARDGKAGGGLIPDERTRLARNIKGYDISPDMVRLSMVNLYLHSFTNPDIHEYDTLTSEDKWNEYADVILANPPFMSPKGGIKPHKRFSVQSKRSEVLFVDYMAEHLTPNGRAAIIVPEGIIFQSGKAYKQLRKMLIENHLFAVVSLPAGVFQPYSGVKTSILLMDKALAKRSDSIMFVKIENDGFDLGAQRRPNGKSGLPEAVQAIVNYKAQMMNGEIFDAENIANVLVVAKETIGENEDWNLSGERYRENELTHGKWDFIKLGDETIFKIESGGTPKSDIEEYWNGNVNWATLVDLPQENFLTEIYSTKRTITDKGLKDSSAKLIPTNSVILSTRATIGRIGINRVELATNQGFKNIVIKDPSKVRVEFVALMIKQLVPQMENWATGGTFKEISKSKVAELQIPSPPLEIQNEIVAEIEGYQKIIDGARAVVDNYKPHIQIEPEWEMVELIKVTNFIDYRGKTPSKTTHGIPLITAKNVKFGYINEEPREFIAEKDFDIWMTRGIPKKGDVLFTTEAPLGNIAQINTDNKIALAQRLITFIPDRTRLIDSFLMFILLTDFMQNIINSYRTGSTVYGIKAKTLKEVKIPLPPLETQKHIVARIEKEQALVNANKELITIFEQKINDKIASVWGE